MFDFAPLSWSLPHEAERMFRWVDEDVAARKSGADVPTFICKPAMGLQVRTSRSGGWGGCTPSHDCWKPETPGGYIG